MSNDFQQTVNLREKMEQDRLKNTVRQNSYQENHSSFGQPNKKSAVIDQVYKDERGTKPDLKKIIRPEFKQWDKAQIKRVGIIVAAIIFLAVIIGLIVSRVGKTDDKNNAITSATSWHAVSLVSGEIYYGQITDIKANPVVVDNVYYDYDQQNKKDATATETGNIRLVKKGKESYGPSGKMMIYQAQIKTIDELKADSKVRQAILDYESKK